MKHAGLDDGTVTILYVEDESETRNMVAEALQQDYPQHRLLMAADGAEGLSRFREARPEVVITDIRMPVMDGVRMAEEICAIAPDTELIALTAYSDSGFLLSAIETGFSHYVLKPVDVDKLFVVLEKSLTVVLLKRRVQRQHEQLLRFSAELEAKSARLEEANRELAAFNHTVAHDLRGYVNTIGLSFQTVLELEGSNIPRTVHGLLESGYNRTRRMGQLIDTLLRFSETAHLEPKRELLDAGRLAGEVADELAATDPERCHEFRIAAGVMVDADPKLLRIVLENLIGNAWKYTGQKRCTMIEFGSKELQEGRVLFVRDNGNGFDPKDADQLFVPYQRLPGSERFQGSGLGLATVQRIIRRHGGRIWAEGEPGRGATFYFTLGK